MKLETVFIDRNGVKVMINKSDLTDTDKLWVDDPEAEEPKKHGRPKKVTADE